MEISLSAWLESYGHTYVLTSEQVACTCIVIYSQTYTDTTYFYLCEDFIEIIYDQSPQPNPNHPLTPSPDLNTTLTLGLGLGEDEYTNPPCRH